MSCRKAWWLAVAMVFALLAAGAALGEDGKTVREVAIPGTGLALRVPAKVVVSRDASASPHAATLSLEVQSISSFPRNGVITRAEVLAQRAALAKGQGKVADAWSEDGLEAAVPLPIGGYAVVYPQYSAFEVCDVRFSLNAAFFAGEQRVILRYTAPPAAVIKENPAFFGRDKANCGNALVWKRTSPDILKRFHEAAKTGRLGPDANAWQADFAAILSSLHKQARAPREKGRDAMPRPLGVIAVRSIPQPIPPTHLSPLGGPGASGPRPPEASFPLLNRHRLNKAAAAGGRDP